MLQKIFSGVLIFSLLALSACSSQPSGQTSNENQPQKPAFPELTFDYPYSETQIKSFTENDTAEVIEAAGPYYTGAVSYEQPALKELQQAKKEFVATLNQQTDELFASSKQYFDSLNALQDKYVGYIGNVLEFDKKFKNQAKEMAEPIIEGKVMATSLIAQYESFKPTTTSEAAKALLEYQKTVLAQKLVLTLTENTAQNISGLLTLSDFFNGSTDEKLKATGSEMENQIQSMIDDLGKQLATLQDKNLALNTGLKQLNTAEHLMGLGSVQFITNQMPQIEAKLATLTPNENLTKDDIEFIKTYGTVFKQYATDLSTTLQNTDSSELLSTQQIALLSPKPEGMIIPVAIAEEGGYLQQGWNLLKSGASKTAEIAGKAGSLTMSGLKKIRTATGVTLDTLGAATKSGFDVVFGAANGNSASEIANEIGNNFEKIGDNYDKGISGSETLKTAKGFFEGAEKAGGAALSGAVEKTIGKGWTSWAAGHLGTMTVNMFTGFGKGITKLADPQSSTGTIAEGILDVGLSFIGGSKAIAKGSQIASGAKDTLKTIGEKGINFIGEKLFQNDIKALKGISADILKNTKLTPEQIKTLISNSLNIELKEAIKQDVIAAGKKINQKFIDLLKSGGSTVLENTTVGAKEAYVKFVEKTFENSLTGLKNAMAAVLGGNLKGYIDNLVGKKANGIFKEMIKDFLDKESIKGPGFAPELKDLAGKWDSGSMTVTDVVITDAFREEAKKEGCDISGVESSKGKKTIIEMSLSPTSETGGNMSLQMGGGEAQIIPFTYKDGVISATTEQKGATMTMNMNTTEAGGAYSTAGSLVIDYKGGELKVLADTSATKPIPVTPKTTDTPAPSPTSNNTNPPAPANEIQSFANT